MNARQAIIRTSAGIGASLAFSATFLAVPAVGGWHGTAYADTPSQTVTVDGRDYPVCRVEDCSDQPGQIGVWFDRDGTAWFSVGEHSIPLVPGPDSIALASSSYPANECQYEDGNTDGMPCSWQDPDSGRWYSVSSENYR